MDVFLTICLPVSGCKNVSVRFIYSSNSLYDCMIGRSLCSLTNIHPDVFLPVVKMPCSQILPYCVECALCITMGLNGVLIRGVFLYFNCSTTTPPPKFF